jgi:glyoxylase-like metal-dependent hydrolase (beta-lactamase superfamily II)
MNWQPLLREAEIRDLRDAESWFTFEEVGQNLIRITEPWVNDFMRSNMWLVRGERRDLLVDTGNGVASLRDALASLHPRNLLTVATHAHADHIGSLHEFPEVWAHRTVSEAIELADPDATLAEPGYAIDDMRGLKVGPPRLSGTLASARPQGFDPAWFGPKPLNISRRLEDGDMVDIGDRAFEILHLPGHSPGCISLYDRTSRLLIAGDVIYDGPLVDDLHHSDKAAYRRSLSRLRDMDIDLVLAGHMAPFDGLTLQSLIADYLRSS